jgi:ligand-binding sensor protein
LSFKDSLHSICNDIELITGIKTVIYDENQKLLHAQPNGMCDFCKEIRRSPNLKQKCFECDEYGFMQTRRGTDIYIYRCHMGLTEAMAPVLENGRTVGYLLTGQILTEGCREAVRANVDALTEDVDREALYKHLDAMPEIDEQHLHATLRILAMSASYVRVHEWIKQRRDTTAYKIESYVFDNLSKESLTASSVCMAMGFSRTALYNVCIKSFGMGISEYIRSVRCNHAVKLLQTTSTPLSAVADAVGIPSVGRLTRLLKLEIGMGAKQIRSLAQSAKLI